jgi:hypothetical protein
MRSISIGKIIVLSLFAGSLFIGCAGRKSMFLEKTKSATGADPAALRAEADALWEQRGDTTKARDALAAYQRAFAADPTNVSLGARLIRAHYLVGYYVEKNPIVRDTLYLRGAEIGEQTLATNAAFRDNFAKHKSEKKALALLDKNYIEAVYWTGANLSRWASTKSMMTRMGNKGRIEAYNQRVREIDPDFFHAAPHRFFGALPTKVPFGNMDESKREFEAGIAKAPNYFGTRTLFAELYAIKRQDRKIFKEQLEYVINGDPAVLPDVEPENRYEQEIAKKLLAKIDEYFEKEE